MAYDATSGSTSGTNGFQNSDHEVAGDHEADPKDRGEKGIDGSGQRSKASDIDDITKEILATPVSISRCFIVTQAPFPLTACSLDEARETGLAWSMQHKRHQCPADTCTDEKWYPTVA
ncbi:hypothetical protein M405DRAFT_828614 [Rhizopogon salebrosus TDB-379]|nr:hypothetical protein M405DRAFT_828614 [Rhizopogon salebrosus TDB-379]